MKKIIKKLFLFLCVIALIFGISACDTIPDEQLDSSEIVGNYDEETKRIFNELLNYDLIYQNIAFDTHLSHSFLWDGYDPENMFGPTLDEENRFYTFLTEYGAQSDEYYLLYLKSDVVMSYESKLQEYENKYSEEHNYHFTSYNEHNVIDGKYLYCHQSLSEDVTENVILLKANSLSEISYKYNDYQLVFCAKSRSATIKENLSTSEKINKPLTLYLRTPIVFEYEDLPPIKYEFEGIEGSYQRGEEQFFNFTGELIEAYGLWYSEMTFSNYPSRGFKNYWLNNPMTAEVIKEGENKYLALPRYTENDKRDLLDSNTQFKWNEEDVFKGYKQDFLKAFVKEYNGSLLDPRGYYYALYDYDAVVEIIRK